MTGLFLVFMAAAAPTAQPLTLKQLHQLVTPPVHAWADETWALRVRYVVAGNLDLVATARGNVDLVKAEWIVGILYARTDLRLRSFGVLASVDRGLTPGVLASSVVLGSQFAFTTTMPMVPTIGVRLQASPNVLAIQSAEDALKAPMQALLYVQLAPSS